MARIRCSSSLIFIGIVAVAGGARASAPPLVVAVEVAPGVDVGAAEVRQAVANELGTPVVGSREPIVAVASDVLLVGIDADELRMSLHPAAAPMVSRTIATPSDRSGRLRAIGWLAGNLVRDQVGPIVSAREALRPPEDVRPATEPPPPSAPPAAPEAGRAPDVVVAARPAAAGDEPAQSTWMVTAGGGPTLQMAFGYGQISDRLGGRGRLPGGITTPGEARQPISWRGARGRAVE